MTEELTKENPKETASQLYFKKVEDALQPKSVQVIIKNIRECSDSLSKNKITKSLEKTYEKYRKNITSLSEIYVENYIDTYGELRKDEQWMFMESSYFAPGEGHMTCLLMTQALPCSDDYDSSNQELVTTQAHRAIKEFCEEFGPYSLHTLAFHTREAFFDKYSLMIPHGLIKLKDKPCMLTFKTKLHYHFP